MAEVIAEKIDRIESLLLEINAKIDNFIGFEDIEEEEKKEVEDLQNEIKSGKYVSFDEVFGD